MRSSKQSELSSAAVSTVLSNADMASSLGRSRENNKQLRIVLLGKTGTGKSATGNTILGKHCFESKFSAKTVTVDCSKGKAVVDGQQVAVIDTPGLFDTRFSVDQTTKHICQCIAYAAPGPHVFLVVIRLGRYTEEEKQTVQRIQETFGQAADRYSMVLFNHGDLLEDIAIEEFLMECSDLRDLVARCNGQYHVFNNKLKDCSQVTELFQKIRNLVQKNGGSHYTNEIFQEAERAIEREKQRILREKEELIRRDKEEVEKKLLERYEIEEKKIHKHQAERDRVRKEREEERRREEERQSERKRERHKREKEITNMMNRIEEQHVRELGEEREKLQSRYENEARDEAEDFNPVHPLLEAGGLIAEGVKLLGRVIGSLFKF